ncbi:hypothetical protein F511_26690 [Dorcoceras hygrometricum]|uniref:Uncharacterized protein n=1 Tax=Dorcoceras hygrometricum TaxID=472368 RepID=A0A2Z7D619_9LAMI|nr:hypothetical protein F511_26690 [Dorcoceras hygrometricum]
MYYELMDPYVHGMVKWQHRGVTYRDPEIEHAEPLGSLGLNGASDDPAEFTPTDVSRGNRHFTVGGGRQRQSGPRSESRLLRQPALEGLTRSARTDSPRQVGRNKFRRSKAVAAAAFERGEGAALLARV